MEKKPPKNALVIFSKFPESGKVKTRIAKTVGSEKASLLYRAFFLDLCGAHMHQAYDLVIGFTPVDKEQEFLSLLPFKRLSFILYPQKGKNLGEKMFRCFKDLLKNYRKITIIGADSPQLNSYVVKEAFQRLVKADIVLGPSEDGGYYLIAMKRPHDIFKGISWGTDRVLEEQLINIKRCRLNTSLLDQKYDIDTWQDALRLKQEINRKQNSLTVQVLEKLV